MQLNGVILTAAQNVYITNKPFVNVAEFKYSGTTVGNQSYSYVEV
jgi:hypothetical protein